MIDEVQMFDDTQLIAHRGASAYAPENTLAAFQRAHELGARWVEFDVMLTKDDTAVVFHDDALNRTTNGRGMLDELSFEELQQLDAGSWFSKGFAGEKVPSFKQVIDCLARLNLRANIEIKPGPGKSAQTTTAVLALLNQFWPSHLPEPLLSSFDLGALKLVREVSPDRALGLLLHHWQDDCVARAADLGAVSIHCHHYLLTKGRIATIKEAGLSCLAYTVNRQKKAHFLLNAGVDAIFSDYPDLLELT